MAETDAREGANTADSEPKTEAELKAEILEQMEEDWKSAEESERDDRLEAVDDLRFARLSKQWDEKLLKERTLEGRPCLQVPRLNAFIRQVVNDARQNKPSLKVHPVDSSADPKTADVFNGIIRNIEYTSNADVAYDTAVEYAVSSGRGYIRVGLDYAHDDTFDLDLTIERVSNPFSIYGDHESKAADSSDWRYAFVVTEMSVRDFKKKYKGKDAVDFDALGYKQDGTGWFTGETVRVAEYWTREEVEKPICQLADPTGAVIGIFEKDNYPEAISAAVEIGALQVKAERVAKSWQVTQRIVTGAEILETNPWPGKWIPIVPVYGDEVDVEGRRHFRSLIRDAKDAQRMLNYWRSLATELVALAPKVPYLGPVGSFATDPRWATANKVSHPFLEYDLVAGGVAPQRQQLDTGVAAGALQEALNATDDIKSITGIYDASIGQRSNETSGKAIMARQREGDTATFHFTDNQARAIRHVGRILIDLIPQVYNEERVVRTIGEDGTQEHVALKTPEPVLDEEGNPVADPENPGQPLLRMFDLSAGKYDLTTSTGPSYTTRRQEAAEQMTLFAQAAPDYAPILMPMIAKNSDWPGADELARKLEKMSPDSQAPSPEDLEMLQGALEQAQAEAEQANTAAADLKATLAEVKANQEVKGLEIDLKSREVDVKHREIDLREQEINAERQRLASEARSRDQDFMLRKAEHNKRLVAEQDAEIAGDGSPASPVATIAGALQQQTATLTALVQQMNAPKQILRDADGKVVGVQTMAA